jgi:hypothetical protein
MAGFYRQPKSDTRLPTASLPFQPECCPSCNGRRGVTVLQGELIQTLFGGGELDPATGGWLYLFGPEGSHVTNFRTEQQPS